MKKMRPHGFMASASAWIVTQLVGKWHAIRCFLSFVRMKNGVSPWKCRAIEAPQGCVGGVEKRASLLENVASLLENMASLLENVSSLLDNVASPLENMSSLLENVAALLEKEGLLLKKRSALLTKSRLFPF